MLSQDESQNGLRITITFKAQIYLKISVKCFTITWDNLWTIILEWWYKGLCWNITGNNATA